MGASHLPLAAQQVTDAAQVTNAAPSPAPGPELPDAPGSVRYPVAEPVPAHDTGGLVTIESDDPQRHAGSISSADGHVIVTYGDRTAQADHIEYNGDTEDMVLTGHVLLTGGENQERIQASHGTLNLKAQTGRFYDVNGSVGVKFTADTTRPDTTARGRMIYTNNNPFLFTGRIVVKTGPKSYDVYDGTVTSCQLPKPDWLLSGAKFSVDDETARAKNSVFHLMSLPLLWLPYVTHAVHAQDRQSGFLVPQLPWYTSTKGFYAGEEVYWAINRSSDAILGTTYYSQRGWAESGTYRYRGRALLRPSGPRLHPAERGLYQPGRPGCDLLRTARLQLGKRCRTA